MGTLNDKNIIFSKYIRFMENKDEIIIINGRSGAWLGIDNPILNKIKYCVDNRIAPSTYIDSLNNITEKQQLIEAFEVLFDEGILVISNEKEEINIKEVEFKITNKCNLKCLHCSASSDISKVDTLATEEIKAVLDKIFKLDIDTLLISGGEPLIRQDIKTLLPYIRNNFKGEVNLITNGTLIDKEMASLLKQCVSAVSISMDGYDKISTEFVRGKGVYDKIIQAIDNLKEVSFNKESLSISMTVTNQNSNHEDDFNFLCEKLDVNGGLRKFSPIGRGFDNYDNIGINNYSNLKLDSSSDLEEIRESLDCHIICRAGTGKFSIDESGELHPCLLLDGKEYSFGNIVRDELNEIFNSKEYINFINNKIMRSMVDDIPKCKNCNVRYFCMDSCLGYNNSYYNNNKLYEEKCKHIKPYLTKVLWDE
ncbi:MULTISPECIES: radical SAM/SPASM domain-containing protein [unclassified Clostridium]|uniref:radical SAM/SPASM domain-containing protein n=1 Tax=unclassified Clostridium TaxID=2614128 RepID=UPI0025BB1D76|nr:MULTISPECIES: radical SAM protein [unclassified Clostridium]